MSLDDWDWAMADPPDTYPELKPRLKCKDCEYWEGPGIQVDHAHCLHLLSPHPTTSKLGDTEYDCCVYIKEKSNKRIEQTLRSAAHPERQILGG